MNEAVLDFIRDQLCPDDIAGKHVLEAGALDVNGTPRSIVAPWEPCEYTGIDIREGPGVDRVLSVSYLVDEFGDKRYDVVISTEMLEHVQDWQWAISQLKRVLAPGGILLLTTRSPGFPHHDYPHDFWRFTESDMHDIFSDMKVVAIESDPMAPGVFVAARRPFDFVENSARDRRVMTSPPIAQHSRSVLGRARASIAYRLAHR